MKPNTLSKSARQGIAERLRKMRDKELIFAAGLSGGLALYYTERSLIADREIERRAKAKVRKRK